MSSCHLIFGGLSFLTLCWRFAVRVSYLLFCINKLSRIGVLFMVLFPGFVEPVKKILVLMVSVGTVPA
jgi:hypothetical protein